MKQGRAWHKAGLFGAALALSAAPASARVYNLYVLEQGANQVQVVQTDNNGYPATLGAAIPVGNAPVVVKATPDYSAVWAPNGGDGTVTVINTYDNTTLTFSLATGGEKVCAASGSAFPCTQPGSLVFNQHGAKAYVLDAGDHTVKVVDTYTKQVLRSIAVGNYPAGLALTPDGRKLYVSNLIDNTVSVINTRHDAVVATITIPGGNAVVNPPFNLPSPSAVAVSPDGEYVYVTNAYDNNLGAFGQPLQASTVSVISTQTNTVVNTIPAGGFVASSVSFTRHYPLALVANTGTVNYPDSRIGVIDTATQTLQSVITEPAPIAGPAEIDPEHRLVYVPSVAIGGDAIVTIGLPSLSIVNTFTLPAFALSSSLAAIPVWRW